MYIFVCLFFVCVKLDCNSTSDSGPNSPPTITGNRGSPTSAPIQEENEDPNYEASGRESINDLSLYTSPSMPNISLGRPHLPNSHTTNYVRYKYN